MNHSRLQKAKVVTEKRQKRLKFTMGADEQEYNKWRHALDVAHLNPTYLLVPVDDAFAKKGLCGDTGSLEVQPTSNEANLRKLSLSVELRNLQPTRKTVQI